MSWPFQQLRYTKRQLSLIILGQQNASRSRLLATPGLGRYGTGHIRSLRIRRRTLVAAADVFVVATRQRARMGARTLWPAARPGRAGHAGELRSRERRVDREIASHAHEIRRGSEEPEEGDLRTQGGGASRRGEAAKEAG